MDIDIDCIHRFDAAYLRKYFMERNTGGKSLEERLREVEKKLNIETWPDPCERICTRCGYKERDADNNMCGVDCGGFTERV